MVLPSTIEINNIALYSTTPPFFNQPTAMKKNDNRTKSTTPPAEAVGIDDAHGKKGYAHHLLKEIHEQPEALRNTLRNRLKASAGDVHLNGLQQHLATLANAHRIVIIAGGSSWHAALTGEYLIEELARIPVEVEYSSEFRHRNPVLKTNDVVLAVSQSGETADTLAAVEEAVSKGAAVHGICNNEGSKLSEHTVAGVYTHAGPEIGVAGTKTFTTQIAVFMMLALELARIRGTVPKSELQRHLYELEGMPQQVHRTLQQNAAIEKLAKRYTFAYNFLYLGRGINYPMALEGALKLKELAYIHAEGYPAAEMKHGPIALIDREMPVVVIATNAAIREKIISNMQEIKARKGHIIAIIHEGDDQVAAVADHAITIPRCSELFSPLLTAIPVQLLAYHIAVMRGCSVDAPRSLKKEWG